MAESEGDVEHCLYYVFFYSYQDTITQNINVRFYCQFNSETNLCILFKVLNDLHFKRF